MGRLRSSDFMFFYHVVRDGVRVRFRNVRPDRGQAEVPGLVASPRQVPEAESRRLAQSRVLVGLLECRFAFDALPNVPLVASSGVLAKHHIRVVERLRLAEVLGLAEVVLVEVSEVFEVLLDDVCLREAAASGGGTSQPRVASTSSRDRLLFFRLSRSDVRAGRRASRSPF